MNDDELRQMVRQIVVEELSKIQVSVNVQTPFGSALGKPKRSVQHHKISVIEYLKRVGTASRKDIAHNAGVPQGTLSSILLWSEFERVDRGVYRLKRHK